MTPEEARRLPEPFARHPHATAEHKRIAEQGMILRVEVGSTVHGISVGGDDRDELGMCLELPEYVTGVNTRFEQYERHTAWDRPGGLANRSGVGDLDVTIYSARKWCRLALAGNPTVLLVLFVPDPAIVYRAAAAAELLGNADRFVSRQAAARFRGYLDQQRKAMTGEKGAHTNRPELVAKHGYDSKFAAHAVRLGVQGVEFLTTGRITLPMPEPHRSYLRSVRAGAVALADVLAVVERADADLARAAGSSTLPDQPDYAWVNSWLHRSYLKAWEVSA